MKTKLLFLFLLTTILITGCIKTIEEPSGLPTDTGNPPDIETEPNLPTDIGTPDIGEPTNLPSNIGTPGNL